MKQQTSRDMESSYQKKKTKREEFLEMMAELIPWEEWGEPIRLYYPADQRGAAAHLVEANISYVTVAGIVQPV